eukprot:scaffold1862_cov268-Chaetoceros_neogracile.AAC.50
MARLSSSIAILLAAISYAAAFSTAFLGSSRVAHSRSAFSNGLTMRVVDIDSEDAFDKTVSSAGASLVVVDYSTTWCGPCKGEYIMHHIHTHDGWMDCKILMRCRYFPDLTDGGSNDKYPDAVFLKVIGDASPDASKLMKREGVRSVPSFHYFKDGEKVDVVNGANAEAIEAAITKNM